MPSLEPEKSPENSTKTKLFTYWNQAQKLFLFTYAFLISPTSGIILEYLDNHSINYTLVKNSSQNLKTPQNSPIPTPFLLTT